MENLFGEAFTNIFMDEWMNGFVDE